MVVCSNESCQSDDLELIAVIFVNEYDFNLQTKQYINTYTEGIYMCPFCGALTREEGIDIDGDDYVIHISRDRALYK